MRRVILSVLMLVICFSAFTPVTYCLDNGARAANVALAFEYDDAINLTVKEDMITQYYINLKLENKTFYIKNTGNLSFSNIKKLFEKNNFLATFIFTYNNMTITEKPVITSWNMNFAVGEQINTGGYGSLLPLTFAKDADINVRSIYYDYFSKADLNDISISIFVDGYGYPLVGYETKYFIPSLKLGPYPVFPNYFDLGAKVYTRSVPSDYDYLLEEGQLPDNGGINIIPQDKASEGFNFLDYIIAAFKAVFAGNANVMQYIIVFVICLASLFLLGLVIKILTWIFK
ncbi:MAG TPA: hypothetical protein GX745_00965 [Clostridiales bacterium]|nr:hypothetical protein [Clostridiales bacterium]